MNPTYNAHQTPRHPLCHKASPLLTFYKPYCLFKQPPINPIKLHPRPTGAQAPRNLLRHKASPLINPIKPHPRPTGAQVGDILMLTKPLGTHYAVKAHRWLSNDDKREELLNVLSRPTVEGVYKKAAISMASLNINGNKGL